MYLALKRSTTQGSFFKNNSLTSFHPLLLKALLFSEIASPSSVPPPLPPSPLPTPLCHVLVFICWFLFFFIFPLCKKWKAENRMSEGGKTQEAKAATAHRWNHCLPCWGCSLLSALTVTDYNTAPNSIHIHHAVKYDAKGRLYPVLRFCIPMWYSHSMTRGTALISHRELHRKTAFKSIQSYKPFEKLKPIPCMFLELVINHAHCSVTGAAKQG